MQDDQVFWWYRAPDPAWQRELSRLAPVRDHLSHLVIAWYAGRPELWTNDDTGQQFVNGQRWVVFEAVPQVYVWTLRDRLLGMPYESSDVGTNREYLFARGCVLTPFWTIQGDDIGHPYRYTNEEGTARASNGLPDTAPLVGELAYSEPTARTWRAIYERSLLVSPWRHLSMRSRHLARRRHHEREARRGVVAYAETTEEVTKAASDVLWTEGNFTVRRDRDDPKARFADTSETVAHYLDTGLVDRAPGT